MNNTIQIKRNKPTSAGYRVLYAKTGRKRRLNASTAAAAADHSDLGADVPNVGIGRALLVILLLHILAIAAIYIHSTFFGDAGDTTANKGQVPPAGKPVPAVAAAATTVGKPEPAAPVVEEPAPEPAVIDPSSERYIVVTGDTYGRIAETRNVDERALRALNSNRPLRAGVVLDLPAELSSRPVDPTPVAPVRRELIQSPAPTSPVAVVSDMKSKATTSRPESARAVMRESGPDVSNAPKAIVVKPNRSESAADSAPASGGSTRTYTIRRGDTLWRIANRFDVSRDAVLKLNGIKNPDKLYAGRTIRIPAK